MAGLRIAKELGVKKLRAFTDSQLVVGQTKGEFEARDSILAKYLEKVQVLISNFKSFKISHIPRAENA